MNIQGFLLFSGLFCSSVTLSFADTSKVVDRVEAIVNKKAIYKSDVKKFKTLTPLRAKIDPIFSNDPIAKKTPSETEVIDFLVTEMIILEKFPVSEAEVEQEITSIQNNLHIDRDSLRTAITREGFSFEDYQNLMKVSIAKRQLIDREIRNKAVVSDDELKAEYNRSRSGSKNFAGSFHLYLIKVTKKNYKTVKNAKDLYEQALKELGESKAFEEVAKKVSDDSSASSGGDLGFLSYQDMTPALQKEVQKILSSKNAEKEVGKFEDASGFTILKIAEVSKDVDSGFDKEKEMLRGKLLEGEFRHQIQLWIDRQKSLNYIRINKV